MNQETFFSTKGRLRRQDHAIRLFLLAIPSALMQLLIEETKEPFAVLMLAAILLAISTLSILQSIKRLHDLDMSGWYTLIELIPLVNIAFGLYVLFAEGTKGPNRYGDDPKA